MIVTLKMRVSLNGLKVNVTKHLTLLLFIGLAWGQTMNNIGVLHYYRGEYDKALEHFDKTLTIQEELDNKERVAVALHNIGLVHYG